MKLFLQTLFLVTLSARSFSQTGCTDPAAANFNPSALTNDGSCNYAVTNESYTARGPIFSFATESSGLVYTDGVLWTHNDSGNQSDIFKLDTATGALLQKVSVVNFANVDWEDITADSNYIYVGDFGNNNGTRIDLKVIKIAKSQLTSTASVITITAQAINFSYSDQTSFTSNSTTNFDCESVISIGNSLYLFTKDRGDFQTRVYKLSKTPGTYTISPYTSYNVNGKITGADYNQQKNEVALIGYMASSKNSFIYFLNNFSGDLFFSGNKRRVEIGNATQDWQTEGITYASPNELFISCETSYTPATLYSSFKPFATPVGLKEQIQNISAIKIFPNPSQGNITIESDRTLDEIIVTGLDGKIIFSENHESNKLVLSSENFGSLRGCFILKVLIDGEWLYKKLLVN